jgi:RHS repeat-associated protein
MSTRLVRTAQSFLPRILLATLLTSILVQGIVELQPALANHVIEVTGVATKDPGPPEQSKILFQGGDRIRYLGSLVPTTHSPPSIPIKVSVVGPCGYTEIYEWSAFIEEGFANVRHTWWQDETLPPSACDGGYIIDAEVGHTTLGSVHVFGAFFVGERIPDLQLAGPGGSGPHGFNPSALMGDPVNMATGSFYTTTTDAKMGGLGIPFAFTRSYNSGTPGAASLSPGWMHSYDVHLDVQMNGDVVLSAEEGQSYTFTKQTDGSFSAPDGNYDTLVKLANGTYRLTRRDQVKYLFASDGRLTSLVDRNGQGLTFTYTSGNLTSIFDNAGRETALTYTIGNKVRKLSLPDGRFVRFSYTSGLLTEVLDLRGNTVTYGYDATGLLNKITDQAGNVIVQNTYDSNGRVISQTDALGHTSAFNYSVTGISQHRDVGNNWWSEVFAGGRLVKRTDPLGNQTVFGYDANSNVTEVVNARGEQAEFTYDANGNMLTQTDPLGNETVFTFTAKNDPKTITDPRGNVTTFTYTGGNLTQRTDPGNLITSYERDAVTGAVTGETNPNGHETAFSYDTSGNLATITDPAGGVTTLTYDSVGRLQTKTDALSRTWTYGYNAADQLASQTDPIGNTTTTNYFPVGTLSSVTDANNHTTSYEYDPAQRLKKVTAPGGTTTLYDYDPTGNLIRRTDANGHVTTFAYDDASRLESVTNPLNKEWQYQHDPDGNLSKLTLPDGQSISYLYDEASRLEAIDYSASSTPDVGFGYDANGNRTTMTDGAGVVTYTYDALNELKTVTRGSDQFAYEYDDAGNVEQRTYPDGTSFSYNYDAADNLTGITSGGATTSFNYNPANDLKSTTFPNGTKSALSYDAAARVKKVVNTNTATGLVLSEFSYTLDPVGNPTKIITPSQTIDYTYDARDWVKKACYTPTCSGVGLASIEYDYDGVGNRLEERRIGATTTVKSYVYDDADHLTSVSGPSGTESNSWDDNGNQTSAGPRSFGYDSASRLTSTTAAGATESYSYDGEGNRLTMSNGGTLSRSYLWDTNAPVSRLAMERNPSGGILRRYLYGRGDTPLAMSPSGGQSHFYLPDRMGSIANLTSPAGGLEWSYTYEPFGAARSTTKVDPSAPANPIQFAGELRDSTTDMYNLRARMYDPSTGRFRQMDPLPPDLRDPYVSTYIYVNNRPTLLLDPSGESFASDVADVMNSASAMASGAAIVAIIVIAPEVALPLAVASLTFSLIGTAATCYESGPTSGECRTSAAFSLANAVTFTGAYFIKTTYYLAQLAFATLGWGVSLASLVPGSVRK